MYMKYLMQNKTTSKFTKKNSWTNFRKVNFVMIKSYSRNSVKYFHSNTCITNYRIQSILYDSRNGDDRVCPTLEEDYGLTKSVMVKFGAGNTTKPEKVANR